MEVQERQVQQVGHRALDWHVDGLPFLFGRLLLELDGYNAPLTAGNFAALVARGFYDGAPLSGTVADETVFALPAAPPPLARTLPLEVRAAGEYEPRYRAPLDVLGSGELPVLPLSVYGSVAMARGTEGNDSDGAAFFIFRFVRATAGLGGGAPPRRACRPAAAAADAPPATRQLPLRRASSASLATSRRDRSCCASCAPATASAARASWRGRSGSRCRRPRDERTALRDTRVQLIMALLHQPHARVSHARFSRA